MSIMANIGNTFNIETQRGVPTRAIQLARDVFKKNALNSGTNLAKLINADMNNMTFFEELLKSNTLSLSDSKKILTKVFLKFDELTPKNQEELLRFLLTSKSKFFQALTNFESVNANAFKAFKDKLTQFNNIRNNIVLTDILSMFGKDKAASETVAASSKKEPSHVLGFNPTLAAQFRTSAVTVNSKGSNQNTAPVTPLDALYAKIEAVVTKALGTIKGSELGKKELLALAAATPELIASIQEIEKVTMARA
jgi:DNA-directed RNA polymerase subunit F